MFQKSLFIGLFCLFVALSAKIVEVSHFDELPRYVQANSLVLVDIDDTLMVPAQTLGSDVWFRYRVKERQVKLGDINGFEKALLDWEAIRHLTEMNLVEDSCKDTLQSIQKNGIDLIGFTTQGLSLATTTSMQLLGLGIDLSASSPFKKDLFFTNEEDHGILFRKGILFTSGQRKGETLFTFLNKAGKNYDHIVFINDKESHLQDVAASCKERAIEFVGLRYSFSDYRVDSFDSKISTIQWKQSSFDHILSDIEASSLLKVE